MTTAAVIGCGLIGTSVGMALMQAGWDVYLSDAHQAVVGTAVRRGAGVPLDDRQASMPVDLAVVAVPPLVIARTLKEVQRQDLALTYTHVCSAQSHVQHEVEALGCHLPSLVGGHPLAGRERSGPAAAVADLFVGRPWAICPNAESTPQAVDAVRELVTAVGADAVELPAEEHDAAVARLSHLPQVVSSALAASLLEAGGTASPWAQLAGPGLIDTTRLAASDPDMWLQILELNANQVAPAVQALGERLLQVSAALLALGQPAAPAEVAQAAAEVRRLLREGNEGRSWVPVKRGAASDAFGAVRVTVSDEPGRLAALLADAGAALVNVEDVHVEHVPGRPTGIIELAVGVTDVPRLVTELRTRGWAVAEPED